MRIGPTARTVPDRPTDPPEAVAEVCGACYWFEPCPCRECAWGVCRFAGDDRGGYVSEFNCCRDWREA